MERLNEISRYLQGLILLGVTLRVIFCFVRLQSAEEERELYKKRIKHAIMFLIFSQLAFVIKDIVVSYY